jgi:nucleoid DNA-binding protein
MPANKKAAAPKKAASTAAAKTPAAKKVKIIKEPMTKSAMLTQLAEDTSLSKKDIARVIDALADVIEGHLKKGGAGQCSIPGLMKIKTVRKPATKARKGINPFTKEEVMFKAKPARTAVKVLPLKKLKDMAN